jgi:hypothetical protein
MHPTPPVSQMKDPDSLSGPLLLDGPGTMSQILTLSSLSALFHLDKVFWLNCLLTPNNPNLNSLAGGLICLHELEMETS